MPRKNSKKKGNGNERELTKWFTQWTGYEFARVPASGGLRWKNTQDTVGDIICTDKIHSRRFKLTIETKFYQDINFEHIILGNKNIKVLQFWEQAKDDGKRAHKVPLLFMRYNMMPKQTWFVMVTPQIMGLIRNQMEYPYFEVNWDKEHAYIINSNDLLKVEYRKLHKLARKILKLTKK